MLDATPQPPPDSNPCTVSAFFSLTSNIDDQNVSRNSTLLFSPKIVTIQSKFYDVPDHPLRSLKQGQQRFLVYQPIEMHVPYPISKPITDFS
jgi:hypothetical protein